MTDAIFLRRLAHYFPILHDTAQLPGVPDLLREEEFCASLDFDVDVVARTCGLGYIPMGLAVAGRDVLLVKCHRMRCVLDFLDLHVGRSTRRRARGLRLRIDSRFDDCLRAVVDYHPDRWLVDSLCDALRALHREAAHGVRAHSVEVYAEGRLVAGEIGYACGRVYTSLSGFHLENGAGTVQLACLGRILDRLGFAFWDLGMEVDYKLRLGARLYDRAEFLTRYRSAAAGVLPRSAGLATMDVECSRLIGG